MEQELIHAKALTSTDFFPMEQLNSSLIMNFKVAHQVIGIEDKRYAKLDSYALR
jgi:hypothetical protein